jgi:hypothetical protein
LELFAASIFRVEIIIFFPTLKVEEVGSPDMLLPIYQTRQHYVAEDHNQCHIPEDYKTDTHCPGNLNLRYIMLVMLVSAKQGGRTEVAFLYLFYLLCQKNAKFSRG